MRRRLPWALAGLSLALTVGAVVFLLLSLSAPVPSNNFGFRGFAIFFAVAFTAVGPIIAARRPENPIGWLLLVAALASGVQAFTEQYATYALLAHPGSLPVGVGVAWVQSWIWVVPVGLLGGFVFPLFPNGRLLSARWRWVLWLAGIFMAVGMVGAATAPGPIENFHSVQNPLGVGSVARGTALSAIGLFPMVLAIGAGAVSLVLRFRRASGEERQQVKWIAFTGVFVAVMLVPASISSSGASPTAAGKASQIALLIGFAGIPVGVGIAVLRYRLYDIDRIINRTLVYGLLTALLGGVYIGLAVGLGSVVGSHQSSLVIAGSTLVVAALFTPARRRIQGLIDRRFYRHRYDAVRTLETFTSRLRDEVDLDELRLHLLGVVRDTMQPAHASLWLRGGEPIATVPAAVTDSVTFSER